MNWFLKLIFTIGISSIPFAIVAQDLNNHAKSSKITVLDKNSVPKTTFIMYDEACLIGPMEFFDWEGKTIFKLDKDIQYPTGCLSNNIGRNAFKDYKEEIK